MSNKLSDWATAYIDAGMSIIPIGHNKKPNWEFMEKNEIGKYIWEPHQHRRATVEEALVWCASPRTTGLALVCGDISGGLRCFDFDEEKVFKDWTKRIEVRMGRSAREILKNILVQRTSRGYQVIHRMFHPKSNQVFAWRENTEGKTEKERKTPKAIIETRENGGYCLLPPSIHPSGWIYTGLPGYWSLDDIRLVRPEEENIWEEEARALTRVRVQQPSREKKPHSLSRASVVIDEYNKRHHVTEWLDQYGYHCTGTNGYVRPGGQKQSVYVYDRDGVDVTIHFNTGDSVEGVVMFGLPHDPFDWMKICSAGNDLHEALRLAAAECGIEWDVWDDKPETPTIPIEFYDNDGETVILTNSPEVANMLMENSIPCMIGPSAVWDRTNLSTIDRFNKRIVVFAGDDDAANRTARELDASVAKFSGGVVNFLRGGSSIYDFALVLRNAQEPTR